MGGRTAHASLTGIQAIDAADRRVAVAGLGSRRVWRSVRRILRENALCSIATIAPLGRAHVNTAYFSCSDDLELYFLSHPRSLHCRNLARNRSMAVAVFSSRQRWAGPDRGLQLFGRCAEARGRQARAAEQVYGRRFGGYARWKAALETGSTGRQYRLYRFVVSALKVLDEREFGDGVFVKAKVRRGLR